MSLIYQNDLGVLIIAETDNDGLPESGAYSLMVTKPTGATCSWAVVPTYETGDMTHTTVTGDLNEVGEYKVQVLAQISPTQIYVSDANSFSVFKRLY